MHSEWIEARNQIHLSSSKKEYTSENKWQKPELGSVKVNVDVSIYPRALTFSTGMVMRDLHGAFLLTWKNIFLPGVESVFEVETMGIREACREFKHTSLTR